MKTSKRSLCERCGCRTAKQAEKRCKPHQDCSGEWSCPGEYMETDGYGYFISVFHQPTPDAEGE